MLKLTYTESGLRLERLSCSFECWIGERVTLTLRAGQKLYVEPSTASFLLPTDHGGLSRLEKILRQELNDSIFVGPVDEAFVEVCLKGSWIAEHKDAQEGLFVTTFSDVVELCLYKLWHSTQSHASFLV